MHRLLLYGFLLCLSLAPARAVEVTVFAAASLTEALQKAGAAFQQEKGVQLRYNFGASSTLARQIEEGAPADLFFSADESKMDMLAARGRIAANTRVSLLSNRLVVVAGPEAAALKGPADIGAFRRLALAQPDSVPAGIYAREYLVRAGVWEAVRARVIPTENVRAALAAVESGNADGAIVYKTDALISKKVKTVWEVPEGTGPEIGYPVAVVAGSRNAAEAGQFLEYLKSPAGMNVFLEFGFVAKDGAPARPGATP